MDSLKFLISCQQKISRMDLSDLTRILFIFVLTIGISNSLEDQLEGEEKTVNYAAIDSPFRSQKVNMIWNKARYLLVK